MGGAWKLWAALVAVLCAVLLAACGGSDSSSTSSTSSTETGAETSPGGGKTASTEGDESKGGKKAGTAAKGKTEANRDGSGGSGGGGNGSGGGSGGGGGNGSGGGSGGGGNSGGKPPHFRFTGEPAKHEHPQPSEGSRSDAFKTQGGDNSIQEYGTEQGEDERTAAMAPIAALYRATFSNDWTEVCSSYLSASNAKQIETLAEQSPKLKGKGCAEIMAGLSQATGFRAPDTPDGGIVSFRTEGDTGFAIYWGIDGKGYAYALKSEGGGWKLTALAPTPLQF